MKITHLEYYTTINPGGFQAAARQERAQVRRQKAKRNEQYAAALWIGWCLVVAAIVLAAYVAAMIYGFASLGAQ